MSRNRRQSPYVILLALAVAGLIIAGIRYGAIPDPADHVGRIADRIEHGTAARDDRTRPNSKEHRSPADGSSRPSEKQAATAIRALHSVTPRRPHSATGYSAEQFPTWRSAGEHGWTGLPRSTGCDAREATLYRDGTGVTVDEHCRPTAGSWFDPYTGVRIVNYHRLDIDHRVPKANAWISGADTWTRTQRTDYANSPDVLLTSSLSANREKGARDPSQWKPADTSDWCSYGYDWWHIKHEYRLNFTSRSEVDATLSMIKTCGSTGG